MTKISITEIVDHNYSDLNYDKVIILPERKGTHEISPYASTALSFIKTLKKENIPTEFLEMPETLLEQRGVEWIGPTLLVFSSLYNSNPDFFNLLIEIIKNHVMSIYPSHQIPEVKLNINVQKTKSKKVTNVNYEGTVEGLKVLAKKLEEICDEEK
ncbi:TPA: hypothetical protein MW175_000928 [Acinetobacter baumannii]|nr:hypothetical protein [Acinetobacter baumannii]